jgi:hypothetical protein
MNERLPDQQIRLTCRELIAVHPRVTGRQLRRILKEKYAAVGNTERVFKIWREEQLAHAEAGRAPSMPPDTARLLQDLSTARAAAEENRLRAERAELREQAHQDRWAAEIDKLRQHIRAQPNYAAEVRTLQDQVLRLTVELHATRRLLAERNSNGS